MGENGFICKDINAGGPDKRMSSMMRKNMTKGQPGRSTRGRGSNSAGNDEDCGQQDRKCSKKTNVFYLRCQPESVDDHGHGQKVVPVGKAEGDLGQNHLTTESLWSEMETTDFGSRKLICPPRVRGVTSVFLLFIKFRFILHT